MKIKISKKYYNGHISNNAPIYRSVLIDLDNNILTTENEQYGDTTKPDHGKTKNIENFVLNKFLKEEQKDAVINFAKSIQDNYKEEYFENRMPNTLTYHQIEIDNTIYKFGNIRCKEEYYRNLRLRLEMIVSHIKNPRILINLISKF